MLHIIEDKTEIKQIQEKFVRLLTKKAIKSGDIILGYQGSKEPWSCEAFWFPHIKVWFATDYEKPKKYWNVFGIGEPKWGKTNSMQVQANIKFKSGSKTAGAFAKDGNGNIFLVHSGRIHAGKKVFWKKFANEKRQVICNEEKQGVVIVARIGDPKMLSKIARFVHKVDATYTSLPRKKATTHKRSRRRQRRTFRRNNDILLKDKKGFIGIKKSYSIKRNISQSTNHDSVVATLKKILESKGFKCKESIRKDLVIVNKRKISNLFEIKTDSSTDSLYKAIGQLFYNSAMLTHKPALIAVFPNDLRSESKKILVKLSINCLTYHWLKDKIYFDKRVLQKIRN